MVSSVQSLGVFQAKKASESPKAKVFKMCLTAQLELPEDVEELGLWQVERSKIRKLVDGLSGDP